MEAKLYVALYRLVRSIPHSPRRPRQQYDDKWVVLVYLWSVSHQQPAGWACDERNWPATLDRPLISQSRLRRRLRTVGVSQLLERVQAVLTDLLATTLVKLIDSKPLTVSPYSRDRDAKRGRIAKGYLPAATASTPSPAGGW